METTIKQENCDASSNDEATEYTYDNNHEFVDMDIVKKEFPSLESEPLDIKEDPIMESSETCASADENSITDSSIDFVKLELPIADKRKGESASKKATDKPFECKLCPKKYPTLLALQHHMLTHTGEKPRKSEDLLSAKDKKRKRVEYMRAYYLKRKTELNERRKACRIKHRENSRIANQPMVLQWVGDNQTVDQPMALQSIREHYCGQLRHTCVFCKAIHFYEEQIGSDEHFKQCCHNGKIVLSEERMIKQTPTFLFKYFTEDTDDAINFRENIRTYNSALAFAYLKVNIAPHIPESDRYVFKIHGQMHHRVGNLHSLKKPCCGQIYILDSEKALEELMTNTENQHCSVEVMKNLQTFLISNNPYAKTFKAMVDVEKGLQLPNMKMGFTKGPDKKRPKLQTRDEEIAAVFIGPDEEVPSNVDFIIYPRNGPLNTMPLTSPNVDPMVYPLLFPSGEKGWEDKLLLSNLSGERNYITLLQYYAYRLAIRPGFSIIHSAGKLFQQYIVDAYVKVESSRLLWIKQNQYALHGGNYRALSDHMTTEASEMSPGKLVILPPTFIGSPRNLRQNYLDATAIIGQYGKPDYFITFTCNPKWKEITENIKPWEKVEHRPDLVARVFSLKLKELLKDLLKNHAFGVALAHVYVIEFEKDLPRAHILLIVQNRGRVREIKQIDKIISAEIPDNNTRLYDIVKTSMVHGPCGLINPESPCMSNGKCAKKYPRAFCSDTLENVDGYVQYKRRNDGKTISVNGVDVDNRWIVPYSPYLSLKYNAPVGVESCASLKSTKYLFKYLYKGHDCASSEISNNNEIDNFVNSRYISAPEAAWRLFEFKMFEMSHTVYKLAINLPNEQQAYCADGTEQTALEGVQTARSSLTEWFNLNKTNLNARQCLYTEIPKHFVFTKEKQWKERQRGFQSIIGRIYFVNPTDSERFYLRLLLLRVKGATCFDDLKTHDGIKYNTFYEAASAWGLVDNDEEWKNCLTEAVSSYMPSQMRLLFSLICIFHRPANVTELWAMFRDALIDDFTKTYDKDTSINLALYEIQNDLILHDLKCTDFNLPNPDANATTSYLDSKLYNVQEEADCGVEMYKKLNAEQAKIVDDVIEAVYGSSKNKLYFIHGPAGTGKTYLYSVLLHMIRGKGDAAEAVAWTGVAASLLKGGRTAHSMFNIPLSIAETTVSTMVTTSKDAEYLKTVKLFIWDEAPMAPKYALEAADKLLRDITGINEPFGGKVLLLGGDFRQVAPKVPHGDRCASVEMCLKNSTLWPLFHKKYLTKNVRSDEHEETFVNFLLDIGNGTIKSELDLGVDLVKAPEDCVITNCLVDEIYGSFFSCIDTAPWASTAILCPTDSGCASINNKVISKLAGKCYDYYSIDSIECEVQSDYKNYTTEFINSLTPSDMPPHHLQLKIDAVIILVRDLNFKKGLCKGIRLIVKRLFTNFIEADILTGQMSGNVVFLPRIILYSSDTGLPFKLKRKQFPIRLAFAITINKAQGQTFDKLGIYLPEPVFSHGQLYLAFSRARKVSDIKIKIENTNAQGQLNGKAGTYTRNIVYNEIIEL